ncbi:tyrosine-type recombinase/integrase [Bythopirellula goksoeyrii]|uniref:Site-specific tyrosine recombinase XerC n=1 Tax=Bythopirellula goksoeyrii TaxID=1400387 RepID=A0A5B9QMD3_9BACT|nr:site-specific integrase [Bythopirellula goksoeyrii]QEG35163.1 site-specific tyrosine recombinase XerC [Bythopirellula goksoeyrii]
MPRSIGQTIPKYRKHRASGQAVCTISGRDYYLGPHSTKASKLEYDRLIAEWLATGRSATYGNPAASITIIELIADYLKFAKQYYGDTTRGTYQNMKRGMTPLKELYGRTEAAEFGVLQFKAIRQKLIDENLSRPYINERMRQIVAVFRWGASEGLIPAVVPQTLAIIPGLRKGRNGLREPAPVKPVDLAVVEQTLPFLSSVVSAMVKFQMHTGCRPGEVCNLKAGDVDRSGAVWEARLKEHKTAHHGYERTIYIGPQAQEVLTPFLLRSAEDYCFSPAEAMQEMRDRRNAERKTPRTCGNRVGTNRRRKPTRIPDAKYTTQSYGRAVSRGCELAFPHELIHSIAAGKRTPGQRAELREWNTKHRWAPNQLRHSLATKVRREFDIDAAKTLLGHQSIGITEVYAEKDRKKAIEVARMIG